MENKVLTCKGCGHDFDFTVRDQEFFAEKGFVNEPQRCRECRIARKSRGEGSGPRVTHDATCAQCGVQTTVPFRPRGDRPVYCRECFSARVPVGVG